MYCVVSAHADPPRRKTSDACEEIIGEKDNRKEIEKTA